MVSPDPIRCLVTGATGYIGGRLVTRLLQRGHRVRAMARHPDRLDSATWVTEVEVTKGDLTDPDSLTAAFDGVDVVYYLVHSMGSSADFVADEERSARNVVAAAGRAGVRRLVYLGGLHPPGAALSAHLKSRTAVGEILIGSDIETVVLQAGIVVGSGSASFELIRHLTNRLPVMTTPKWVHNKIQPIAIGDVLHYLTEAATAPVPRSRTWDVGGPDVLEYGEAMQVYADAAGLRRRSIVVLPWLTPTIASLWIGLVTPIPPGLARPLIQSLECDAVVHEHDIDGVIPAPDGGLTGYRDAVVAALRCGPLPTDPRWAGQTVHPMEREAWVPMDEQALWSAVENVAAGQPWNVETRDPGQLLRLSDPTHTGRWTLEMRVGPMSRDGTRYHQRAVFEPRGLAGEVYWYFGVLRHRRIFRQVFESVLAATQS